VIKSFADQATKEVFDGNAPRGLPVGILSAARRKLRYLDAAETLMDLKSPPGNRLHPLVGDRAGQHSIWINDQYRLCFRWTAQGAYEVEVADYH
jgi:proteic killer suppression protein